MKVSETLRAAKALIDTPEKWTKGWYYRDAQGKNLLHEARDKAYKFCSLGALRIAKNGNTHTWPEQGYLMAGALNHSKFYTGEGNVHTYNDEHTHEEVMLMWDRAIALAEADEAASQEDA